MIMTDGSSDSWKYLDEEKMEFWSGFLGAALCSLESGHAVGVKVAPRNSMFIIALGVECPL